MKKKLAFLAAPILALGLIASPVRAESVVEWEKHEVRTDVREVEINGQKLFDEQPNLVNLEVCLRGVSYDKIPAIDQMIKEYFELITKDETVRRNMENTFRIVIPENYTRKEINTQPESKWIIYKCSGISEYYSADIIYHADNDKELVIELRLIANHEYNLMLKALKKAGVERIPKSLEDIQITGKYYPS